MGRHDAIRTPAFNGPAGWSVILPPVPPRARLEGQAGCDIAIVGGGFAGLSAARRLHQIDPGLRVVILEAARISEGGTGRNSGFMIDLPHELTSGDYAGAGDSHDQQLTRLNRQAIAFAAGIVEEFAIPEGYFQRAGKINGAASDAGVAANESYARHLRDLGEAHERLDARAMREITGSAYYRDGLYTPGTVMIQPAGYVQGLAAGIERGGVTIHENSAALRIEGTGQGWTVATAGGTLSAERLILANNGHLESFGFKRGQLMHIMLNACMTEELDPTALHALGGRECWGITPADPMGTTVRRIGPAQGGTHRDPQGGYYRPDATASRPGPPGRADAAQVRRPLSDAEGRAVPVQLVGAPVPGQKQRLGHARAGAGALRGLRRQRAGHHAQHLTGIGAAAASAGKARAAASWPHEAEPARLPPHPFDTIGANAYLRWKEWQTRLE
ncbi:NAD(P)/FAD-dependent oxidoreductase [Paracoccus mutanolyticus]|uniref:NAD(P)/FAD-dependent oxidoreductase n=1 Tax=Paracoccus mutanolyticus TaxID=1499308 RepID=UPI001CB948E7|nr:FAD-dependent oxidoreductase [Paracoccus mutanolyticus]